MGAADWGNVPQWVSATGTSAGFAWVILMFRVELRRRRVSYATPLIVFTDREHAMIVIRNVGEYPYFAIDICVDGFTVGHDAHLRSGDERSFPFDVNTYADEAVSIEYTDIRNQQWRRSVREAPRPLSRRLLVSRLRRALKRRHR
jgi:hypothetical protein